jgi:hypothetical protein
MQGRRNQGALGVNCSPNFFPKYEQNLLSQKALGYYLPLRQGFTCPLDFQTFLRACNVRPKLLESKAFVVLTIKLVQRKVKVGINKDMYCTVLLIGRLLMDYFTKGMSPFCS